MVMMLPVNSFLFTVKDIYDPIRLLQADLNHAIWQSIRSQIGPVVVPLELGHGHGLEEIRHGQDGKPSLRYNYSDLTV